MADNKDLKNGDVYIVHGGTSICMVVTDAKTGENVLLWIGAAPNGMFEVSMFAPEEVVKDILPSFNIAAHEMAAIIQEKYGRAR